MSSLTIFVFYTFFELLKVEYILTKTALELVSVLKAERYSEIVKC